MAHKVETDPSRLRKLAERARRLSAGTKDAKVQDRFSMASSEYEQRAKEIEMDEETGQ